MTTGSVRAGSWRGLRDSQGGHGDPQPLGTPMPGTIPRMSPPKPGCDTHSLRAAITPSMVMGCHHPPTGATLQCHPPVPPPVPGTLRPPWLLCDPPSSCHGHSVPAHACHRALPVAPLAEPRENGARCCRKGPGKDGFTGSPGSCRGELASTGDGLRVAAEEGTAGDRSSGGPPGTDGDARCPQGG